jgi:hypothetical protein
MTTLTWSMVGYSTNDASFRAFGSTLRTKLTALGLVRTADTGQIDWTTVTRPGTNAYAAAPEIWRFNDALQATAPIYFRLRFGTPNNGSPAGVAIAVQVGTGSNGSGALTGLLSTEVSCHGQQSPSYGGATAQYASLVDGKFSMLLNVGSGASECLLSIHRSCDNTGADTATGCIIAVRATTNDALMAIQCLNFASVTQTQTSVQGYNTLRFGNLASSAVSGNYQAYLVWGCYPAASAQVGLLGYVSGEVQNGNTFTCTPFGSTSRTYLAAGGSLGYIGNGLRPAILWE